MVSWRNTNFFNQSLLIVWNMAYWVVGGAGCDPAPSGQGTVPSDGIHGSISSKKRVGSAESDSGFYGHEYDYNHDSSKRLRVEDWPGVINYHQPRRRNHLHQQQHYEPRPESRRCHESGCGCCNRPSSVSNDSIPIRNLSFLVIRETNRTPEIRPHHINQLHLSSSLPSLPSHSSSLSTLSTTSLPSTLTSCPMERTQSGLSISSDTTAYDDDSSDPPNLLSDLSAARLVRKHLSRCRPNSQPERILKSLINPKHDFLLDNDALRSIFSAANELFFANRLTRRVTWDWSHQSTEHMYAHHIVGTTAVRRSTSLGGYETLIVLSSPILKDTQYNRRLLISTFLHEMIHSFLFVACGLKARAHGGHTEGFRQIAETIDMWVGKEHLRLSDMEANLERFRDTDGPNTAAATGVTGGYSRRPCQEGDYSSNATMSGITGTAAVMPPFPTDSLRWWSSRASSCQNEWQWHGKEDFGHVEPSLGSRYVFRNSRS